MNRVSLVGRLTSKPELRYTSGNLTVTRFSVAVNRTYSNQQGQKETDFINIVAWRKQAENICNFLDKGSLVSVDGRIQTGSYEKDGEKRYTFEVVAESVQFLESKSQNQSRSQGNYGKSDNASPYDYQDNGNKNDVSIDNDPFADFGDSVSIDDNFLD
jgi:single-strand DNA-binding protein